MRRFLIVGCGGSGGATLQFVMDQLRADLSRYEIPGLPKGRLPAGWQFVHVDVPVRPDGVGEGMPPTVDQQGGRYVPLAYQGATYDQVWRSLEQSVAQRGQSRARTELATWAPDPHRIPVPIANGAGQRRAVGRVVTLPQAKAIFTAMEAALDSLNSQHAINEVQAVAEVISNRTAVQVGADPLVIIVSSMAGGAGASMVLDVAQILAREARVDPNSVGMFLYTPQVFDSLAEQARLGVDANGLAAFGELLSTQFGAGLDSDANLLNATGLVAHPPTIPFQRVFPIGSRIGTGGAVLGDGRPVSVYRAIGRGLAALMLSGSATQEYVSFDLGNPPISITDVSRFGWGASTDATLWGSFGFASIGLGRDRYLEYAAQRMARVAVDRAVNGHLQPGDTRNGADQLAAAVDATWPWFVTERLGLPGAIRPYPDWLAWQMPQDVLRGPVTALFERVLEPTMAGMGGGAQTWLRDWLAFASGQQPQLRFGVDAIAYQLAWAWYQNLLANVERAVVDVVAQQGIPVAHELLGRVAAAVPGWRAALEQAAATRVDLTRPGDRAVATMNGLGNGAVNRGHAAVEEVRRGHLGVLRDAVMYQAAGLVAQIMESLPADLLDPLRATLADSLRTADNARNTPVRDRGQARVETDEYSAWPTGIGAVPDRFGAASNEVLLTGPDQFEPLFTAHTTGTMNRAEVTDALSLIVTEILSGQWTVQGGAVEQGVVIQRTATWLPKALPKPPDDPAAVRQPPRRGAYRLLLAPADVLGRARTWVGRSTLPFKQFAGQSLREHLTETGVGQAELDERAETLRSRFRAALSMARPLVGVNAKTFHAIHGSQLLGSFKFSELPFQGLPVEADILADLKAQSLDPSTQNTFTSALDGNSMAARIDIFGSHMPCSPLVFSSLLQPIAQRWAVAGGPIGARTFWEHRRARRLPGGLGMTDAARRACIGGFFVGRVTGCLLLPGESYGPAAEVYDTVDTQWLSFPDILLTDPTNRPYDGDLLPALLESHILALALCHADDQLGPLLPYRALRNLYDNDPATPFQGNAAKKAATVNLRSWIQDGRSPSGSVPDPALAGSVDWTPQDRADAIFDYLTGWRDHIGVEFLWPGQQGAPGRGHWSTLHQVDVWNVPLFHEIAADAYKVLGDLLTLVDQQFRQAPRPHGPGGFQ